MSLPSSRERHARGDRSRGTAGRSAGGAGDIPRVVGLSEDLVERLVVAGVQRRVGLAGDDRTGRAQPRHGDGVVRGYVIAQLGGARSRGTPLGFPDVLHGHDEAVQRSEHFAASERFIGGGRISGRPFDVERHHGVQWSVHLVDAGDDMVEQLDGSTGLRRGGQRSARTRWQMTGPWLHPTRTARRGQLVARPD